MKTVLTAPLLTLALWGAGAAFATPHDHGAHAAAPAEAALADGLVKKIDRAAAKLTLSHGPLPNGMPAMTMAFRVAEPAWLDGLQPGQKVRFAIDEALRITRLEPAR